MLSSALAVARSTAVWLESTPRHDEAPPAQALRAKPPGGGEGMRGVSGWLVRNEKVCAGLWSTPNCVSCAPLHVRWLPPPHEFYSTAQHSTAQAHPPSPPQHRAPCHAPPLTRVAAQVQHGLPSRDVANEGPAVPLIRVETRLLAAGRRPVPHAALHHRHAIGRECGGMGSCSCRMIGR